MNPQNTKPVTFILVEDNLGHATLFNRFLYNQKIHNEVIHLNDGRAALDFVGSKFLPESSIMVLDLNLPLLHGSTVLKAIRRRWLSEDLPVLVLSTTMDRAEIAEVQSLKCQGCLRKPLEEKPFYEIMDSLKNHAFFPEPKEIGTCLYRTT